MSDEPRDPSAALIKAAFVQSRKSELRTQMRSALQKITPTQSQQDSLRICQRLIQQSVWLKASAVLCFVSRPDEPDLLSVLEAALAAGKIVVLPRYVPETGVYVGVRIEQYPGDCAPGYYGIVEPRAGCSIFPLNRLDLALVPGLGFDLSGRRLGRGKGYYDRILAEVTGSRCGVAFDEQLLEQIPAEPHDIAVNRIITPTQWMEFPAAR